MNNRRNSYKLKMQKKYSRPLDIAIDIVSVLLIAVLVISFVLWLVLPHEELGLEYREISDRECKITGKGICIDTDLIIPSSYGRHRVVGIDNNAFYADSKLKSVVMQNGIVEIGTFAYYN